MLLKGLKRIAALYVLLSLLAAGSYGLGRIWPIVDREFIPHPNKIFHVEFDGMWSLSFAEARDLALYFDGLLDTMGEAPFSFPDNYRITQVAAEVLPFFEYEGGIPLAMWPSNDGQMQAFQIADQHIHAAGQSDCSGYVLNYRFYNPFSEWFGEGSWYATVVHELVHVQQFDLCDKIDNFYIELTAEIVSTEVLAAMVNYGDWNATWALVDKLRGMAMSASYGIDLRDGDISRYMELREQIFGDDPYRLAGFLKSRRHWEADPDRLEFILDAYSIAVLEQITQAILYDDEMEVEGLILPPGRIIEGKFVPGPPFKLDDLAYFLEHSQELVDQYVRDAAPDAK